MKIAYYTEVNLEANDGPAVNELEFITSLRSLPADQYLIFLQGRRLGEVQGNVYYLGSTPRISQLVHWWQRYRFVAKKMQEGNVNLLICRLTDFPFVPLLIEIFNPKIKLAIKTAALWWAGRQGKQRLVDKIYNFLNDTTTKLVYRLSDAVDVAMQETHDRLLQLGLAKRDRITLIDNAINIRVFAPQPSVLAKQQLGLPADAVVLGFAGSLPSLRGAAQILQVAEKLQDSIPQLYVLIIGSDPSLAKLISATTLSPDRVLAPGLVEYNKVAQYVAAMTICYSFFEPHKIKTTGNASQKVKQYLSMGKPVISVATGHKYLADNALGAPVDQENIDEIARQSKAWIERVQTEGEALVQRLHAYAKEHLSTEHTFKQRINFWRTILQD